MTKVSFSNMKLKNETASKKVKIEDTDISFEVLQYLPIADKYDLIEITLQKSLLNGVYNPLLIEMYFNLHLVYLYTNINFTDKQKEDEKALYDKLQVNKIIDYVVAAIPEDEYNDLYELILDTIKVYSKNMNSFRGVLTELLQTLPEQAQKAEEIVKQFKPEDYQNVIEFARAANGGRDINTNR